jgi:hypothetical protein
MSPLYASVRAAQQRQRQAMAAELIAGGNAVLMRRVAEINAIAKLKAVSQSKEFTDAAKAAAKAPLHFAQNLANDPVATLSSVPEGIFGFLNRAKEAVTNAVDGNNDNNSDDNVVEDLSGFAKMKRDIAIKLGVDPYTTNETFQNELSKVAWPAFLGKFAVNLGMAATQPCSEQLDFFSTRNSVEEPNHAKD